MTGSEAERVRGTFRAAVEGFLRLVQAVPPGRWDDHGLGEWTMRDLVGHASRALATVEAYLGKEASGDRLEGPAAYFLAVAAGGPGTETRAARDRAIAERGREAGAALGDDPAAAVGELAGRVVQLVWSASDEAPCATPAGPMTLLGYLPTRTFELAIHGLDLARALGVAPPEPLAPAVSAAVSLAGELAASDRRASEVLEALGGRRALPEGFTVV